VCYKLYLIYNREYELVGEAKDFGQVQEVIGADIREQDVNSLAFIRGKTVLTEDNLKRLVHQIVTSEKNFVVDYITSDVEDQEDETVELKTSNHHLQNKVHEAREYLSEVSTKIGKVLTQSEDLSSGHVNVTHEESKETYPSEEVNNETVAQKKPHTKESKEEVNGLDKETMAILNHIEQNHQGEDNTQELNERKSSVSRVLPSRKKTPTDINFISILDGGKVTPIKDLKGKTLIKTSKLADDVGLDREHIEFIIGTTLEECGGTPKYQNKSVVSPAEAVWVIVSALTKREGFGNTQRFQKTKENAEDFYQSWEQQKDEITNKLS